MGISTEDSSGRDDITEARWRQLNESFYAARPADFIRTRMLALLVLAGRPDGVAKLLEEGIEYERVRIRSGELADIDADDLGRHVTLESQVLLHHAAEAVLRLYVAHVGLPPVPWIALSSIRSPGQFKQEVKQKVLDGGVSTIERDVASVFLGSADPPEGESQEDWQKARANVTRFLQVLARRWLDEAEIYNAIKHGLAATPGDAVFQLLPDGQDPINLGAGTSLQFLERTAWDGDRRTWSLSTAWVDTGDSLALVHIAAAMIDSLWFIAKYRYVDGPAEGPRFFPVDLGPTVLDNKHRAPVRTMSWPLVEEHRDPH